MSLSVRVEAIKRGLQAASRMAWLCLALVVMSGPATAAVQVFDVDETQSTFTAGSIDVNFTATVHSTGIFGSQTTTGQATVMNPGYAADGTVSLDVETGQVTIEGLDISGMVGQSGSGQMVWADILTLTIVYNIVEQALSLNAPLTMPLAGGAFSGTPNFEFTGISDGAVTGIINYGIAAQSFGNSADLPISGMLSEVGGNTVLDLTASQLVVDLGSAPTITTTVNDCALQILVCVFYITTADITVNSLVYNDVQMTLVGTAPSLGGVCGDGSVDPGEGCDDGNTVGGDGCSATCQVEICGDGVLDVGEACDDGNTTGGDGCSATCQIEACGNGVVDVGETCDDGNTSGGDGCSSICAIEVCGNGVVDVGEGCDDGNVAGGDGCSAICQPEVCGNGVVDPGEGCDDGNTAGGDGCSATCAAEVCGNGVLDVGEGCDDGNTVGGDGCSETCVLEACGNGALDPGEGCDDGNVASGDGCSSVCQVEECGNGVVDFGEVCDDGNTVSGDGCNATCTQAVAVPGLGPWAALLTVLAMMALAGGLLARRQEENAI